MANCPVVVDPPDMTPAASRSFDWFTVAAVGTWLVCGIWPFTSIAAGRFTTGASMAYAVAFAIYGSAMLYLQWLPKRRTRIRQAVPVVLAALEATTGLAMNLITVRYIHGTGPGIGLLVIVAAQLPYFSVPAIVWPWITVQTVLFAATLLPASAADAITLGVAFGAFQIFAAASSFLAISEGIARRNLARANAELQATRSLLAESSRAEERLRISRDLHDTLGHHLTALSLQLDVASRLADGTASDHVRQAHAITRLLLGDVRDVVSRTRETTPIDTATAIRALAGSTSGVAVHVDMPPTLDIPNPAQADALLKSVQELITNAVRHAGARTLSIRISRDGDTLVLSGIDDGRGAAEVAWGNGLTGMRERFRGFGGDLDVETTSGRGFAVRAAMPVRSAR